MSGPLLYLVAGEPSGDRLGGALMTALTEASPGIRFAGVGGQAMRAAGLTSLFDMADLTVMGLTEVLPRLPTILSRLHQTTTEVIERQPAALITIDAPSFGLRVAARVRAKAPRIRTIHYVAPSVWAWRPGRARHMARFVDHVLALLPFEPPHMEAAGMSCDFVGHPIAGQPQISDDAVRAWRADAGLSPEARLLLVAPGSRRGELARLGPVFGATVTELAARQDHVHAVLPVAETVIAEAMALAQSLPVPITLIPPDADATTKRTAFAAADTALVSSGTIALEMAAAGTPHVSCYRVSALTAAIARRLIRVETGHLVNLVLGEPIVPERMQEACTPEQILPLLEAILAGGSEAATQRAAFERTLVALGRGGPDPAARAAASVLAQLDSS
ncbi:MAG: lipid-A-disaccharide synthase [Pseudomonadota bacterium]